MGIYIAEDAPKGCLDCKLHNYLGVYAQCFWTKSVIDEFTYDGDPQNPTRPDDCPLLAVAPHGRLIDTDAVILEDGPYDYDEWCKWALEQYQDAPTVIEAEEE